MPVGSTPPASRERTVVGLILGLVFLAAAVVCIGLGGIGKSGIALAAVISALSAGFFFGQAYRI